MIEIDEEMQKSKQEIGEKQEEIKAQKAKMKDFESTIIEKNLTISKLQVDIEQLLSFRLKNETLRKQLI